MNINRVPYFRPSISSDEIDEVADTLRSGWLTTGPKVRWFEDEFAEAVGSEYAVALNSCTAALHLALEAVGLKSGDLVLVPTMTFASTAEVVRYFDAVPLFVDCNETLCIDPQAVRETIEAVLENKPIAGLKPPYGKLKILIPMHYGGYCCRMDEINKIGRAFDIAIVEDAAHSFPAYYKSEHSPDWKHAGTFGNVGCFSFYANKCITTGEGGMAVTDDEALADRMRLMSLHGMNNNAWERYTDKGSWYYEIVAPGFKYNLTDIAAAIGIHQLKKAEMFRHKREAVARRYTERLGKLPVVETPFMDENTRINSWHLYSIRLNLDRLTIDRAAFIQQLNNKGIGCSVHWQPLHMQPYYRSKYGLEPGLFPVAEVEWQRLVSLPIFPDMILEEVDYVIAAIEDIANEYSI